MELEDIVPKQKEDANNAHVAEHKCEYEPNRDACVASLAYLLKPLQDATKELYVNSTLNITNHLIVFVVLVRWCRLLYPLGFATLPLWYIFFHFHYYKFLYVDILKFIRSLFHKVVLLIVTTT